MNIRVSLTVAVVLLPFLSAPPAALHAAASAGIAPNRTCETSYSTYDPARRAWARCFALEMPDQVKFRRAGAGSTQRFDLPNGRLAAACDHRYGAVATWSQTTDTAMTNSMFYAEACGFKFNMALTVFDTPFITGAACVPVAQRQEAARTGRISFQSYFQTDRWRAPNAAEGEQDATTP